MRKKKRWFSVIIILFYFKKSLISLSNNTTTNLHKKNILEIISNYVPQKKLLDIDSKAITYMIENIVSNIEETYQVSSINPFVIEGL